MSETRAIQWAFTCPCGKTYKYKAAFKHHQKKCEIALRANFEVHTTQDALPLLH